MNRLAHLLLLVLVVFDGAYGLRPLSRLDRAKGLPISLHRKQNPIRALQADNTSSINDTTISPASARTSKSAPYARQLLAELVGTFIVVQLGTGSVMSAVFKGELVGLFQVAAVWIIAVTIGIASTASISGAHLNPAISLSVAAVRRSKDFGWAKLVPYWIAQTVGGVLGSLCNYILYSSSIRKFESAQGIVRDSANAIASAKCFGEYYLDPVTLCGAFFAEAFGTCILAAVIFALTHPDNDVTNKAPFLIPPLIGLTVGALICVFAPLTQAGFNPARDFGPRIVAYIAGWHKVAFKQAWLFIVAPCVGAVTGATFVDKVLYR